MHLVAFVPEDKLAGCSSWYQGGKQSLHKVGAPVLDLNLTARRDYGTSATPSCWLDESSTLARSGGQSTPR